MFFLARKAVNNMINRELLILIAVIRFVADFSTFMTSNDSNQFIKRLEKLLVLLIEQFRMTFFTIGTFWTKPICIIHA